MIFGAIPTAEAVGAILAHGLIVGKERFRKGRVLSADDIDRLAAEGIGTVIAARLDPGTDVGEDMAAARVAALLPDGTAELSVTAPFTGRVNLHAERAGILRVDAAAVAALNGVDEAITLATLPDHARVAARTMVATVKIIPYGVPTAALEAAEGVLNGPVLHLHPFTARPAALILTEGAGMKPSLLKKGEEVVRARLDALQMPLLSTEVVAHRTGDVAEAIARAEGEVVLILTASATSDRADVGPAGLEAAGGQLLRFGMPVDPGNLLFLGTRGAQTVIGLPGCARSPALNGADWVLERVAAGLDVTGPEIAAMGVGGLLKEIPTRPQPRGRPQPAQPARPRVEAVVLAAGASRRMGGRDKLLEQVGGQPILRQVAETARASRADAVHVVLPPEAAARREALTGLDLAIVEAPGWAEGMAASLRAGIAALPAKADAAVILLADMPEVTAAHIDRLIAAFSPEDGREICRAATADGRVGHPVLFGRRFFETLSQLSGDIGARPVVAEGADYLVDVATEGQGAVIDLDTPEAWADWRAARGHG
ncbi:MAG: molybdopterin-binding/glycosyltransferase family 2 protein [Pseudomonadota bacterium]